MDLPTLPPSILQSEGYLQEANRLFFHPLGLALAVRLPDGNDEGTVSVLDGRDDPEGIIFDSDILDPTMARRVAKERDVRAAGRAHLGCVGGVQRMVGRDWVVASYTEP